MKKQDSTTCCVQKTHLTYKNIDWMKVNGLKMYTMQAVCMKRLKQLFNIKQI